MRSLLGPREGKRGGGWEEGKMSLTGGASAAHWCMGASGNSWPKPPGKPSLILLGASMHKGLTGS